jgi:quercetin dioxygenase-like cupin family protein
MTLKSLAALCHVSTSFLSQAERGLCSISIPTLERICDGLGLTLSEFFAELGASAREAKAPPMVLRSEEQHAVSLSEAAIKYRFLSRDFPGRLFEVVIGEIPAGYVYPSASHDGEEFGYLIQGELRLTLGEEEYLLHPGDSYHFGPHTEHGYEAIGSEPVRLLWVQTLKDLKIRSGVPKQGD